MINLYPKQEEFVNNIRAAFTHRDSVMGQAPTGFGKTVVSAYVAHAAEAKGNRVYFTVHRKNLIRQTAITFDQFGINFGFIAAGYTYERRKKVFVASIETLRRRMERLPVPELLVVDEAHMAASDTWAQVINYYRERGVKVLGNSATPTRLDGKPLADLFDTIVPGPSPRWLMDNGFLSDYVAYAPSTPDLAGVHTRNGEYNQTEISDRMDKPSLVGNVVQHYRKYADRTLAIAYCCSIRHSEHTAQYLNANGIPAAHVDGNTPAPELRKIILSFAERKIMVLCNVDLITTGFDLAAQVGRDVAVETIIDLRPTQSEALHLQKLGRGLRRKPKPCIILDHAGNLMRLGLPDEDREWSLDGRAKGRRAKDDDQQVNVRQCEKCYRVHRPAPVCPHCGYRYEAQAREIEEVDGQLEQITPEMVKRERRKEQAQARTYEDLLKIAKQRGYKPGWARYVAKSRGIPVPSKEAA